ncbi:hypothetical protein B1775_06585 [Dehalococcoides mccartyi]|nr:hypothetical protein X794_06760 [Dehalococcoides mccartyi CG5]AQX73803.1 hypothetical protein B1775_06585 [Dehalococcoides mccartyi]
MNVDIRTGSSRYLINLYLVYKQNGIYKEGEISPPLFQIYKTFWIRLSQPFRLPATRYFVAPANLCQGAMNMK